MKIKPIILVVFVFLCGNTMKGQLAPEDLRGIVFYTVTTKTPPFPYNSTLGKTIVSLMARTGTTYTTYLEGHDEMIQTGISYSYVRESPNVGALTIWVPALNEYATTKYTFTSPDSGTVYSSASIGVVEGTFRIFRTWSWQDQVDYWDQATAAQNQHILEDPSRLGLYSKAQIDQAILNAKTGLFTKSQLDAAVDNATAGLYTKEQLDTAVAEVADIYFKSDEKWTRTENENRSFTWSIKRSTNLSDWQTVGQAEVKFSGDGLPAFFKIEVE